VFCLLGLPFASLIRISEGLLYTATVGITDSLAYNGIATVGITDSLANNGICAQNTLEHAVASVTFGTVPLQC
jgi:hypothetical protein